MVNYNLDIDEFIYIRNNKTNIKKHLKNILKYKELILVIMDIKKPIGLIIENYLNQI